MKKLIKNLFRTAGYELSPIQPSQSVTALNPDITDWEWNLYGQVKPYTMVSLERVLANVRAIDHVVRRQIPGDIVECGVWRGGSAMSMAMALVRQGDTGRTLWLYDTFSGMTEPLQVDVAHCGVDAASLLNAARQFERPENSLVWACAPLSEVRKNMMMTNYPINKIRFVEGPVERMIPNDMPERIAVLRLDTDWYESTRHELVNLYPRLSAGGILIIDDYGHWQGTRKAVDEYFVDDPVFLHRIDYAGRLVVKGR